MAGLTLVFRAGESPTGLRGLGVLIKLILGYTPSPASMPQQRVETNEKCAECNKTTGCDSWLSCEICDGWFHSKCVGVSEEAYKVLQDLETCHWLCAPCNSKMGKVITSIIKLTDRMAVVYNQVANLEREMKVMSGQWHMAKVKEGVARDLEKFSR